MQEESNCRCQKLTQPRIKWLDMNSEAQQKNGPSELYQLSCIWDLNQGL